MWSLNEIVAREIKRRSLTTTVIFTTKDWKEVSKAFITFCEAKLSLV